MSCKPDRHLVRGVDHRLLGDARLLELVGPVSQGVILSLPIAESTDGQK